MKENAMFVLGILAYLLGPLACIWSLNTLFPMLAIPVTFETYIAAFFVGGIFYKS